jgi:hypothetical protein
MRYSKMVSFRILGRYSCEKINLCLMLEKRKQKNLFIVRFVIRVGNAPTLLIDNNQNIKKGKLEIIIQKHYKKLCCLFIGIN